MESAEPATPLRHGAFQAFSRDGFHRIAYIEWGDPGSAWVVVCLHGLSRQGRDFDRLAAALACQGYRVLCPDLVGRGRSGWLRDPEGYALPQYCADTFVSWPTSGRNSSMHRRPLLTTALALPFVATGARKALAAFPDRPITMIVAYPPGGGTDAAARTLARFMSVSLGQPIVVNNRAGAGGEIGFGELARAKPDGYTLGFINTPNVVSIPIERRSRYRLEDFAPIANVVDDPGAFFVLADSPFRSLTDLVAFARAKPEEVTYGTSGIGSDDHLAALAFERLAGVRLTHVPFAGASAVRNALLGKQITIASLNMGEGVADMVSGTARAIGQMAERRWPVAQDTPTFREQGFDIVEGSMRGVAAPAGLPAVVLERLVGAVRETMANPEFQQLAVQQALPLRFLDAETYRKELFALRSRLQALWTAHAWRDSQ